LSGTGCPTRSGGPRAAALCSRSNDYRRRLPHIQKGNRPIFITFTTDRRWKLPAEAKDIVLECCLKENGNKFDLHTAVVMPDHAHLLLSPLRGADGWNFSLPQIMHAIKGASARKINVLLGWSGAIWQEEFFDHVLRSNDSLAEKLITFVRIPCERGWSKLSVSIVGSGGVPFRFSSGERHSGLLGRLTGSETRSHTDSGSHAVSAFRYVRLPPLPR
jgi:REP element-mobilizing transposase RayT